jgi:hypothetical protein
VHVVYDASYLTQLWQKHLPHFSPPTEEQWARWLETYAHCPGLLRRVIVNFASTGHTSATLRCSAISYYDGALHREHAKLVRSGRIKPPAPVFDDVEDDPDSNNQNLSVNPPNDKSAK